MICNRRIEEKNKRKEEDGWSELAGATPNISSSTWTSLSYDQPMMMAPVMGYNVQPVMQQPGMMGVRPMGMQPAMGMQQPIGMQPAMGMQQPMMFGMQPAMGNMMSQPRPPAQTNQDPFGAL